MHEFTIFVLLPVVTIGIIVTVVLFTSLSPLYGALPKSLAAGFRRCQFVLTRGQQTGETTYFYDIDLSVIDPKLLKPIANWYASTIKRISRTNPINKLAFFEKDSGPVGALLLTGLIVERTGIPAVIVRLRRRLLGTSIKGADFLRSQDHTVLVTDVATSGGGMFKAAEKLADRGVKVSAAVVLIHRGGQQLDEELKKKGIELFYAMRLDSEEDLKKEPINKFIEDEIKAVA